MTTFVVKSIKTVEFKNEPAARIILSQIDKAIPGKIPVIVPFEPLNMLEEGDHVCLTITRVTDIRAENPISVLGGSTQPPPPPEINP